MPHTSTPTIPSAPWRASNTPCAPRQGGRGRTAPDRPARENADRLSGPAYRPFEHEAHLKELLTRQAHLNATLDLDKGDAQAAEPSEVTEPQGTAAQHRSTAARADGKSPQGVREMKASQIKT